MKKILFFTALLMGQLAISGNDGGGGDPIAAEFSDILSKVAIYVKSNPQKVPDINTQALVDVAIRIRDSLNDNNKASLVEVVENRPKDRKGISKAAVYSQKSGRVVIHRATWQESTDKEKVVMSVMEGLGLTGIQLNRYQTSFNTIGEDFEKILKFDVRFLEVDIPIPGGITSYGLILWPGPRGQWGAHNFDFLSCPTEASHFSNCKKIEKDIEGNYIGQGDSITLHRPGFYKLISHVWGFSSVPQSEENFEIKSGDQVVAPLIQVKIPPWHGPGQLRVSIDYVLNRASISAIEDAYVSKVVFPMALESRQTNNPESVLRMGVKLKSICESFVINVKKIPQLQRNVCAKILKQGFATRSDYLQLKLNFTSSTSATTLSLYECYSIDNSCDEIRQETIWFDENVETKLKAFLKENPTFIINDYNGSSPRSGFFHLSEPEVAEYRTSVQGPGNYRNISPGDTVVLMKGHYVAHFVNESGETVEVPFEIKDTDSVFTFQSP